MLLAIDGGGYDVVVRHEVGIVVWGVIAVGLATGILPRGRPIGPAFVALGGLVALTVLSAFALSWTQSDEATTMELARVAQYLGIVALAYLALERRSWQGPAAGFAAAALTVPFLAVGARLFPTTLVDDVARAFHFDRLSYPLDYWNAVACWGAMAIATGIAVSAHGHRVIRAVSLATVPVASASVYLTFSRFGPVAVAIGLLAAAGLSRNRWTLGLNALVAAAASAVVIVIAHGQTEIENATGSAGSNEVLLALVLAALVCAACAFFSGRADSIRLGAEQARMALAAAAVAALLGALALHGPISRAWDQFKSTQPSTGTATQRFTSLGGDRYAYWQAAYHAFQSAPSRGIGPGSFEFYWDRHGTNSQLIKNPHSLYLQQLSQLGLAGLAAIATALAGLLWAAIAARRRWVSGGDLAAGVPMIAAFIVFAAYAAVDWMWEIGAVGVLALGGAAVAGAARFPRARPGSVHWAIRTGLVVAAVLALAIQIPTLVSVQRTRAADAALDRDELSQAKTLADQAVSAEPWAASPYAERALILQAAGKHGEARADINRAIDRERDNWRYFVIRAKIDAQSANRAAVKADLARARVLAPRSPFLVPSSPFVQGLRAQVSSKPGSGP
jgi:tetratricopeptide (TPR) repeat protein